MLRSFNDHRRYQLNLQVICFIGYRPSHDHGKIKSQRLKKSGSNMIHLNQILAMIGHYRAVSLNLSLVEFELTCELDQLTRDRSVWIRAVSKRSRKHFWHNILCSATLADRCLSIKLINIGGEILRYCTSFGSFV